MTTPENLPAAGIRVVAICASLRPGSFTRMALEVAIEGARKVGADVKLLELAQWRLPPFDDGPSLQDPETVRFKAEVQGADALLVATPVYHDSYSGSLKNAIDLLYHAELQDKLAALIAVGGGRVGQGQALEHLRAVFRETGTWVLPRQVAIASSKEAFTEQGRPKDPDIETRLVALGQELALRCRVMRPRKRAG